MKSLRKRLWALVRPRCRACGLRGMTKWREHHHYIRPLAARHCTKCGHAETKAL